MKKKWERKKLYKIMKKQISQMIVVETEEMTGYFMLKKMPSADELALLKSRLKEVLDSFMDMQSKVEDEDLKTKISVQDSINEPKIEEKNIVCNSLMEEDKKETESEAEMLQLQRQSCGGFVIKEIHLERGYVEQSQEKQNHYMQACEQQEEYHTIQRNSRRRW